MAINKIPESQLPTRSVSETDYVRVVGADGKSYRVPKTDFNGGGGGGTVDPSLSPTSTNAVQNKAIYSALSDLKADLGDLSDLDTTVKTDLVSAINEVASGGGGALTQDTKQALLQCFAHTAWTDDQGQDYYDDLEDALYPFDLLSSISAVYTQSGTVYDTDSLDSLKADLVVTGNYSDGTYNQTTKYTLSGTLTVGTSTITVTYGGKTATFTVNVTQSAATLVSISANYTQSGAVYESASLDSLKSDLVVTANWSDSTTTTVASADYTLSGTLTVGTSTITVSYEGKTDTFNVTVTQSQAVLTSISAVYTQSGTVYDTDTLDSLKTDLVVTAHYSDSSTATVASSDYTLSGTLTTGTSTVTVSYSGKTTTFTVTVTHYVPITQQITWTGSGADSFSNVIDATQHDLYWELPYIQGATEYASDVTSASGFARLRADLYTDSEATILAGYWYIDTQEISQTKRTALNTPSMPTDTLTQVAPMGYYVKLVATKRGGFSSNSTCRTFINTYANTVTLV